jgi:hypothetical protein
MSDGAKASRNAEHSDRVAAYLAEIGKNLSAGNATEHTHRPALKTLLDGFEAEITATNEPKRVLCGAPDFIVARRGAPLGHVETKDIGADLDEMMRGRGPHGEQFVRYRDGLSNWILTDYLRFHWIVGGEVRLTAILAEVDDEGAIKPLPDGEDKTTQLLAAFLNQSAPTVGTAKELARRMAGMTRIVRDLIVGAFEHEREHGWLHNWLDAFRETLVPDLEEKPFADMFAQTLAYGLFAARVHGPPDTKFTREMAAYNLPKTNPFLRKLFAEIAGVDMPDAIAWAVDDLVSLLCRADMAAVLEDFGRCTGREDPVVHFYETFLAAYDPRLRELRGVYYTPEPVVSYIVRSIDHLLQTRFNRPKGLADEKTLILDPAVGTATFLYFVIDEIHRKFAGQMGAWDDYVAKHLLGRVFGFELLMAPYAVAHLKLGMQLRETGYKFASDQRLGIYLTNSLEEAAKKCEHLFAGWVADEANAAAEIKKEKKIMVVLGNPPYSGISANRGQWITDLLSDYRQVDGRPLGEKKVWLADDYVKFLRFAQWRIKQTGQGIVAMITNHGFLDNPTFRGMRQSLQCDYDEIFVLDLHGATKKRRRTPKGKKDENIFAIRQGVAITIFVRHPKHFGPAKISHAELWGSRAEKLKHLWNSDLTTIAWKKVTPSKPYYFFVPRSERYRREYESYWKVNEVFPVNTSGIVTARDGFVVDMDYADLKKRIDYFCKADASDEFVKMRLHLKENYAWRVHDARRQLRAERGRERFFAKVMYRPFDLRNIFYHPSVVWRPREPVMRQMTNDNLALATTRIVEIGRFEHVLCSRNMLDHHAVSLKEVNYFFPLYLYPNGERPKSLFEHENGRRPNLSAEFVEHVCKLLGLDFLPDGRGDLRKTVGPEDIFHYAYAVFHSPTYRSRYAEFLKVDFPRLPLTSDKKLFRSLAAKGEKLVALHLMDSPALEKLITQFPQRGDNLVEQARYADADCRVWINPTQYFQGVPRECWEFRVGGYQVCEKWLKDRKGRKLGCEEIEHYQKIVVALRETLRLMDEIDECIPAWPLA